jgi:4-hydroxybutyryl-CoA dehydratase/vinylacetyl-CoA-Delta-isomerase
MPGGGSPDGARLVVKNETPLEDYVHYAGNIAGLSEIIRENKKQTG